ncbi:MAG: SH3 domain-containing protein [Caldilineaceae bacterium]
MSFQALPATLRVSAYSWLTRFLFPFVIGIFLVTSTGCSMVMGLFGPDEAIVAAASDRPARILVPTPTGETSSRGSTTVRSGPTPTPFIMRPAAVTTGRTAANAAQSAPTVLDGPPPMRVIVMADSVNIRNAPGLDTQIVTSVPRNTQYEYIDTTDDGAWVQICCVENQLAWIYSELARMEVGTVDPQAVRQNVAATQSTAAVASAPQVTSQQPQNQNPTQANALSTGTLRLPTNRASTTYTAAEAGFTLTLPPTWLAIAEAQGLIKDNLKLVADENPQIAALLENQLSDMQEIPLALIAFDLAPESLGSGFAGNVNVMVQPVPAGFPLDYVVQFSADQLEKVLGLSDAAESTKAVLPAGEAVILDYDLNAQAFSRQYYLLHDQSLYIVTFSAAASRTDASLRVFDEIMQSFRFQ